MQQLKQVHIVPEKPDYAEEISNKQIRAAVEIPEGFDAKLAAGEPMTVKIYMYEGELKSGFGADRLQKFFRDLRDRTVQRKSARAPAPRKPDPALRHQGAERGPAGKSRRRGPRRTGSLFRDSVVPDRRDVSGHGPDRRAKKSAARSKRFFAARFHARIWSSENS